MFEKSNAVLAKMYELVGNDIPLIGVGGIRNAKDAYLKMKLGASLVQLYSGLAYNGPAMSYVCFFVYFDSCMCWF